MNNKAHLDISIKLGSGAVNPYTIPMILGNTAAGIVGMELGAKGPNLAVQTACATATHAFGEVFFFFFFFHFFISSFTFFKIKK